MIKIIVPALTIFLLSCRGAGDYEKAEDAQDAGRQFIRASLDGDYEKAKFYLLKDTINLQLIEQQQKNYRQLNSFEKKEHQDANIRMLELKNLNDTLTSYKYLNTYNIKDTTTLSIVKSNGEWLVDLKSVLKL